ncbi:MAG: DUF2971 domain-containing protein [Pseudomonadota bacterium]
MEDNLVQQSKNPLRRHDRRYFYKYLDRESALSVLRHCSLKWSSPTCFNDPFDVPRILTFDCAARELQEALAHRMANLIEARAATPPNAIPMLRVMLELLRSGVDEARAAVVHDLRVDALSHIPAPVVGFSEFQKQWDEQIPLMRILCLSEVPDIAAMWAHYADRHQGVVLELAAVDHVDSPLIMARQVRYQDDPPKLPNKEEWVDSLLGIRPIELGEFFTDYQLVKQSPWAYEREWRVFSYARPGDTGASTIYHFLPEELTRVIVGTAASADFEQQVRDAVGGTCPHATVFRATLDEAARRIVTA